MYVLLMVFVENRRCKERGCTYISNVSGTNNALFVFTMHVVEKDGKTQHIGINKKYTNKRTLYIVYVQYTLHNLCMYLSTCNSHRSYLLTDSTIQGRHCCLKIIFFIHRLLNCNIYILCYTVNTAFDTIITN